MLYIINYNNIKDTLLTRSISIVIISLALSTSSSTKTQQQYKCDTCSRKNINIYNIAQTTHSLIPYVALSTLSIIVKTVLHYEHVHANTASFITVKFPNINCGQTSL